MVGRLRGHMMSADTHSVMPQMTTASDRPGTRGSDAQLDPRAPPRKLPGTGAALTRPGSSVELVRTCAWLTVGDASHRCGSSNSGPAQKSRTRFADPADVIARTTVNPQLRAGPDVACEAARPWRCRQFRACRRRSFWCLFGHRKGMRPDHAAGSIVKESTVRVDNGEPIEMYIRLLD